MRAFSQEKGTKIMTKISSTVVHTTEGGELESGVKDVLSASLKEFSKRRIAVFGVIVALLYVSTAGIFNWIMSNPPFVQTTINFSGPSSWSYLGMWVYIALLLLIGFVVCHAVLASNRTWPKTFAKRISGMSTVQLFILIIYAPVAVTLVIQYFISIFTGASFPLTDFIGGLLSWTIAFFLFTGLAYVVGNVLGGRTK